MLNLKIKTNQQFYKTQKTIYNTTFNGWQVAVTKIGETLGNGFVKVKIMNYNFHRQSCHTQGEKSPKKGHVFFAKAQTLRKTKG